MSPLALVLAEDDGLTIDGRELPTIRCEIGAANPQFCAIADLVDHIAVGVSLVTARCNDCFSLGVKVDGERFANSANVSPSSACKLMPV